MSGPRPVVLSGPSGAGKSTLLKRLMKDHEGVFGFSVSRTSQCQLALSFHNTIPTLRWKWYRLPNSPDSVIRLGILQRLVDGLPVLLMMEKRLRDRQTETEESLQKRLEAARIDMELSKEAGVFDIVIVNDDLEKAYEELKEILNEEIKKVQEAK
uniref:Guanylate kinase 1b n=1 Tax=Fundulus heteroclitus TaxID=8078 RepID=A0A3Q2U520_FUNHE